MKDGGPAFPRPNSNGPNDPQLGMTLRDYFAAAALQGLLAGKGFEGAVQGCAGNGSVFTERLAGAAYEFADSMLKARESEGV